jgi:hypothetical protein
LRFLKIFIRVEGFNTQELATRRSFRALKKGIKPRIQIPDENNIPRPFRARVLIMFFLFFSTFTLFGQTSYAIRDFGIYVIVDNKIRKVPGEYHEPDFFNFVEQFVVFVVPRGVPSELFLYDIERKIVSQSLEIGRGNDFIWHQPIVRINSNEVLVYTQGILHILDYNSLRIKESRYHQTYDIDEHFQFGNWSMYQQERITGNIIRYYFGGNYNRYSGLYWFLHSDFAGMQNENGGYNIPLFDDYKYIDIYYDPLWKKRTWAIIGRRDGYINSFPEFQGERLVLIIHESIYGH